MNVTTNISLALAGLIFLLLLAALVLDSGKSSDMTGFVLFPILSLAFFALITIVFCKLTSLGEFDWTGWPKPAQYSGVILTCLTLSITIGFSALLRKEPVSQTPWAIRPFVPWAPWILPVLIIAIATIWTIKDLGVPAIIPRTGFTALAAIGILTGLGLLGEALYWNQQRTAQRIDAMQQRESERDRMILEKVKAADPDKDFGSLLAQTNRFENTEIRTLALQKVLSVPNFTARITAELHHEYYDDALNFLRDNDPPDKASLAEPVREAFVLVAENVREAMRENYNPRNSQFVSDASGILIVADKYAPFGVDFVPAIKDYRAALDQPGKSDRYQEDSLKNDLPSRKQLDRWLAVHKPTK